MRYNFDHVPEFMMQWGEPPLKSERLPEHTTRVSLLYHEDRGPEGLHEADGTQVPVMNVIRAIGQDLERKSVKLPVAVTVPGFGTVRMGPQGWEIER